MKANTLVLSACIAISLASCSIPLGQGFATVRMAVSLPGSQSRALSDSGSRVIHPDMTALLVEVSGPDMATVSRRFSVAAASGSVSIEIPGIPVSSLERTISVTVLIAGDAPFSRGSVTRALALGTNSVSLGLVPLSSAGSLSGTGISAQALSSGDVVVHSLVFTETGDYCVSLDYTTSDFWVYDSEGKLAQAVGGSPEKWYIVHAQANQPVFSMIRSRGQLDHLKREKAVYVVPGTSEAGNGSRSQPFVGITQIRYDLVTGSNASPVRFLLARGTYDDVALNVAEGKSIFGGFDPIGWSRDIKANEGTRLRGYVGSSGIIYSSTDHTTLDGNTIIDGIRVDCLMPSGDPSGPIYGMNFAFSPSIRNCQIIGPEITGPDLTRSLPSLDFAALSLSSGASAVPTFIVGNSISSCLLEATVTGALSTAGIQCAHQGTRCLIANNDVDAGYNPSYSEEVPSSTSVSVEYQPWLVNNTIDLGRMNYVSSSLMSGITISTANPSAPRIANNLVLARPQGKTSVLTSYGLYCGGSAYLPGVLLNNGFFSDTVNDPGSDAYVFYASINTGSAIYFEGPAADLNRSDIVQAGGASSGNVLAGFIAGMLKTPDVPDSIGAVAARNWQLSSAAPASARNGALSAAQLSAYGLPAEFIPYLGYDKDGNLRPSSGTSMGAHQFQ